MTRGNTPLLLPHGAPDAAAGSDFGRSLADERFANPCRDVFAVQQHPLASEFDLRLFRKLFKAMEIVEGDTSAHGPQGDRAIHRAGVDVKEA
jgi:hypothetical protein